MISVAQPAGTLGSALGRAAEDVERVLSGGRPGLVLLGP
jgi:hypothetical protein